MKIRMRNMPDLQGRIAFYDDKMPEIKVTLA